MEEKNSYGQCKYEQKFEFISSQKVKNQNDIFLPGSGKN